MKKGDVTERKVRNLLTRLTDCLPLLPKMTSSVRDRHSWHDVTRNHLGLDFCRYILLTVTSPESTGMYAAS